MTGTDGKPYLPSAIALVGLAIITAVTAQMGFEYWYERRADHEMAWISLGCEFIAFGGIAAAMFGWPDRRAWVATGIVLAVAMSVVCGWTAYQRLAEDEHTRAVAAVAETDTYLSAVADADDARQSVRSWNAEDPRPQCECPQTITAWSAGHRLEAERREGVLAQRQARLDRLLPSKTLSPIALARAIGLEAAKLLGFGAFGGVWLYALRRRLPAPNQPPRSPTRAARTREPVVPVDRSLVATRANETKRPALRAELPERLDVATWETDVQL